MKRLYSDHPDYNIITYKEGIKLLGDEIREFIDSPSWDEFSDIMYGLNRLIGGLFGRKYIPLFPGTKLHIIKCNKRFVEYGHFRSKRHLK